MEYKSLILGVLFSIGVFAVKSGAGLQYGLAGAKTNRRRRLTWAGFAAVYGLVFAAALWLLESVDLLRHLPAIQTWLQSGMLVHLLMAAMLLLWGIRLLRRKEARGNRTRAWLLLVMPCPVCATVVLISLAVLLALQPEAPVLTTGLFYGAFLLIAWATAHILGNKDAGKNTSPEFLLGGAMIFIAVYFLLSVTLMPQFTDADKIYRMALASSKAPPQPVDAVVFYGFSASAAFAAGFAVKRRAIRRRS